MTAHDHPEYVPGCYRCDLSRDEVTTADRPRVGDQITTAEQLDALPVGSVLRTRSGALAETGDMRGKPSRVVWCEGWSEHADAVEHFAPLTVLYVPGEQTHPSVDALRAEEGIEAATEAVEAEFASMNAGSDHGARDVAEAAISAYGSALAPVTPADRPFVTDDARAEAVRIIDSSVPDDVPGYRIRYAEKAADALIERGLLAAGRAETTTEDEACGDYPAPCNCDDPETHDGALRTETTTATTEDALADLAHLILDTLHFEPSTRDAEMDDVMDVLRRHLLATARTRPTREQIDAAVGAVLWNASNYPNPSAVLGLDISALRSKVTAAVLALLEGGDDR